MTSIAEILAGADLIEGGFHTAIPSDWLQGRTAYGGLSSALALHAAQQSAPALPPLRSAQVAFIGPLAGDVRVTATLLRRGRNAAFIQSDVVSDAGLGLRATFVFMVDQTSRIDLDTTPPCPLRPPPADATLYTGPADFFTSNFDFLDLKDQVRSEAEYLRWARLRQRDRIDPMVEVLAVADGLPPAAFTLFGKTISPISSLAWIVNFLTPAPSTQDGWWLLSARSDFARNGFSSQAMTIRNAAGELVAEGMQSVAIFG